MPFDKETGTVTPRVSTNTNTPTATKITVLVPMDVFQMSSNVSKTETVEQEFDGYELFLQSSARAEVVYEENVSSGGGSVDGF